MDRVRLSEMPWNELKDWLSFLVHDDKRDIGNLTLSIPQLEKQGADKRITRIFSRLLTDLTNLHDKFRDFRSRNDEPSRAEIDRFLLEYHGRLDFFCNHSILKINRLKAIVGRMPDSELKKSIGLFLNKLHSVVLVGHAYNSLAVEFTPRIKHLSLKRVVENYVRKGVIDREGNPVTVIIQGKDVNAFFDRRMVESSLANLLTDAINHTPGRPIFVRLGQKGRFAVLSVTNEGKKLSVAEMKMIGVVRYSRSKDPDRGWGKLSVAAHAKLQDGDFKAGNSRIGPKLQMFLPRKPRHVAA